MSFVIEGAVRKSVAIEEEEDDMSEDNENRYDSKHFAPHPCEVTNRSRVDFQGDGDDDVVKGQNHKAKSNLLCKELGSFFELFGCGSFSQQGQQVDDERNHIQSQTNEDHHIAVIQELGVVPVNLEFVADQSEVEFALPHEEFVVAVDVLPVLNRT